MTVGEAVDVMVVGIHLTCPLIVKVWFMDRFCDYRVRCDVSQPLQNRFVILLSVVDGNVVDGFSIDVVMVFRSRLCNPQ